MAAITSARAVSKVLTRLALMPALLAATCVHASLVTPIGVSLVAPVGNALDPTPVNVSTTLATGASTIEPDGAFSPNLLPLERIALDAPGDALLVTVQQGDENGGTGWLADGNDRARYVFSGLKLTQGEILGVSIAACDGYAATCALSGITDGAGVQLLDLDAGIAGFDALAFYLDAIQFRDRGADSDNFADFRVTLLTRPGDGDGDGDGGDVPEPGTAALAALALGGLAALRRRRSARG